MRYLGNKTKLVRFIELVIKKYNITGKHFTDLFAGTGSVGDYFKSKYIIIANDFMYYSYILNHAKLLNKTTPNFDCFKSHYRCNIFEWLNCKSFTVNNHFFLYNNYTPVGDRMFFTEDNGLKIDGIRISIEELYRDQLIDDSEYYFLLASLLESVTKVSNTSGTYEAFFKFWESRAVKLFKIEPIEFIHSEFNLDNQIYNEDGNILIRKIKGDILYIDPPYSVTQYSSAYHMLETIARYDFPKIKGIGGKRDKGKYVSLYSRKKNALHQFEDLFRQAEFKHILISYSNQSIVSLDELVDLAKIFALNGKVFIEDMDYKEYQNHRSSKKRNGFKLKEVIIYFEKNLAFSKSPLNYSGSKDTLLPNIVKELPKHIGVFVDAMGGAFNVGANIFATDKVVYNESNKYIYDLIKLITKQDKLQFVKQIEDIILKYNLKKRARDEYNNLRKYFNENNSPPEILYVLHMYAFQNMIRFNNSQKFNTPIGVAGYSDDIKNRILEFNTKTSKIKLLNKNYKNLNWQQYPMDTLFYFDPPYFITNAAYNDGKRGMQGWNAESEVELMNELTIMHQQGYKFILSNVIEHRGKVHHLLLEWILEHKFTKIDIGESGWRYSKNEVLIKNFE